MSDLLAIFGAAETDAAVIGEIARLHPRRVTVLIEDVDAGWALDDSPAGIELRDRLAALMAAIERQTGATVTGLAGSRSQLVGWRFDHEVGGRTPIAA
ncbi:MAG TPA: hypothetical protein VE127_08860 [Solirubrobacteraceae bacterium]|jgi:hypothetical protein|nr:hypothetical protein [Solirubrobacteraceae bacterium]